MPLESGGATRCAKHPSRGSFTGFCPVCLSERLSRVDKAERVVSKRGSYGLQGDDGDGNDDLSPRGGDAGSKQQQKPPPPEAKVRKTLLLLFQMNEGEDKANAEVVPPVPASFKHLGDFFGGGLDDEAEHRGDNIKDCAFSEAVPGDGFPEPESSRISESRVDSDMKASSTSCSTTVGNSSSEAYRTSKPGSARDGSSMSRGSSSSSSASHWLGSALARTSAKWSITGVLRRCSSVHERAPPPPPPQDGGCSRGEKQSETNSSTRRSSSCDWNLCSGSRKNSCEDPRHSWDSSVMGRAFMCSFTCLDEKENVNPAEKRVSDVNESSCPASVREKGSVLVDDAVVGNSRPVPGPAAASRGHTSSVEKEASAASKGKPLKDMFVEDRHRDSVVPGASRRISNRWSRVWNWSISSPLRDSSAKRSRSLDRSLSESWRERHQGKMESDNASHLAGPSRVAASASTTSNRSKYSRSADRQNPRPEWSRSKRDYRFGRSQSVHYSSPGNLDNGLLRFYLTPLRSTNRNLTRGRAKPSRSFTRGIFGLP